MAIDIDTLIKKQDEYLNSIEPVDVQVALGEDLLTVRVPFIMPMEFAELAARFLPRPVDAPFQAWFNLSEVTRNYPNVELVDGDEVDDLYTLRNKEAFYRWPEIYNALDAESKQNVEAAVWGLHVYNAQQRRMSAEKENANG